METQYTVIEWSPDKVRAYDPVAKQTVTDSSVADALRRVGGPGIVGLCLSRRVAFLRESRVPDVHKDQARAILQLRVEDIFPSMGEGVSFDFAIGAHRYDDGRLTTVSAVGSEMLRRAVKEVHDAGAKVAWTAPVALRAAALAEAYSSDAIAVVESDGEFLNIDIVRHGSVVFSRSVLDPGDGPARRSEVARTLAACGVSDAVTVGVKGTDISSEVQSVQEGTLAAMASHDPTVFNVLTPEETAKAARAGTSIKTRLALLLWLAVVCVGGLVFNDRANAADAIADKSSSEQKKRARAQDNVDIVSKAVGSDETKVDRILLAFAPAQTLSEVIKIVSNTLPSGAWLTGLTFERGKIVQIRGTAVRGAAVSEYTAALAQDVRFRDVKLVFANNAEIETTPVVQFAVTAHIVGNLPLEDKDIKRKTK